MTDEDTITEKIADVVVAVVRVATAPLVARCAALEAQIAALEARPVPDVRRLDLDEIRAAVSQDLEVCAAFDQRLTVVETKTALTQRVEADVATLQTQLATLEVRPPADDLSADELPRFLAECLASAVAESPAWQP